MLEQVHRALIGCVFQGPSGCGKSTLAEVFVNEVRHRGGKALYRTASHYLVKWVGDGAANLRADFALLEASYRESGVRPLLVVDELEAIALDRTQAGGLAAGHLDVLDTLLSLLTRTEARMIGISNVADRFLESALLRDGRLRMVRFPSTLGPEQVARLVAATLGGVPLAAPGGASGADLRRAFGDALSDLVFAPSGALSELLRVQLADGRVLRFGARDLATAAAVADGVIRPWLARTARRDWRAGCPAPRPLALEELRQAAIDYFTARAAAITRDSVRSVLGERIPEGQAVMRVEHVRRSG
jgi:SpoVK/Ycf46/Vps4 family AAA+-type ATPase